MKYTKQKKCNYCDQVFNDPRDYCGHIRAHLLGLSESEESRIVVEGTEHEMFNSDRRKITLFCKAHGITRKQYRRMNKSFRRFQR